MTGRPAIVIGCFGDRYKELSALTYPSIKRYAQRIGAEVVELPSRKYPSFNVSYEKLQISDVLQHYERVAWFDTDIIVRGDAPNIFNVVPKGTFGALDEMAYVGLNPDYHRTMLGACTDLKCPPAPVPKKYFNAGVLVVDQSHREMVKIPPVLVGNHFMDQSYLNVRALQLGKDFVDITPKFNHLWICKGDRLSSFVIHYANTICGGGWMPFAPKGGNYLDLIRQDLASWNMGRA